MEWDFNYQLVSAGFLNHQLFLSFFSVSIVMFLSLKYVFFASQWLIEVSQCSESLLVGVI